MEVTLSYDGPANAQALIARFSTGTPRVKAAGTEPLVLRLEENGSGEAGDGGAVVAGEGNGLSGAGARVGHQSRGGGTLRSTRPVLTVDTPRVQYSSVAPSNDCRYLVGVVSGGTMRLVDAEYHELRPRIKAVEAIETTRRALNTREEILTAHTQLTQSFGNVCLPHYLPIPMPCSSVVVCRWYTCSRAHVDLMWCGMVWQAARPRRQSCQPRHSTAQTRLQ
eukprot:m.80635 g.80635  ORF g.80635 m.80635 type:complete len:222 (-) comp9365_c0_seq3:854-1519(-)